MAATWAAVDEAAASAWVASLRAGGARDHAALRLVEEIKDSDPDAAWQWAASIDTAGERVQALTTVQSAMGSEAPEELLGQIASATEAMYEEFLNSGPPTLPSNSLPRTP